MDLRSTFNLGEKVYCMRADSESQYKKCYFCNGKGQFIHKNQKVNCPKCDGWRSGRRYVGRINTYRIQTLTIGEIRIHVKEKEREEKYMCDETGVGSGIIHKVEDLFKTRNQAIKKAEKLKNEKN